MVPWISRSIPGGSGSRNEPHWVVMRLLRDSSGWRPDTAIDPFSAYHASDSRPLTSTILKEIYRYHSADIVPRGVPLPAASGSGEGLRVVTSGLSESDWEALTDTIPETLWLPSRNFVR